MGENIVKVAPNDPWRCQAVTSNGQCSIKATTLGGTCVAHGGVLTAKAEERASIRNYHLAKFQVEMNKKLDSEGFKSLREEVALLRMMLQARLDKCEDINDLVIQSHTISDMILKIEKVLKSCHSLEHAMGGLLDKQALLQFVTAALEIINRVLVERVPEHADYVIALLSGEILKLTNQLGALDEEPEHV